MSLRGAQRRSNLRSTNTKIEHRLHGLRRFSLIFVTAYGGGKNVGARCSVHLRSQKNRSVRVKIRRGGSRAASTPRHVCVLACRGKSNPCQVSMIRRDAQIGRLYRVAMRFSLPISFRLACRAYQKVKYRHDTIARAVTISAFLGVLA